MLEKLKSHPEMRRSLGIAIGIFSGLVAYRLFMWTHEWWEGLDSGGQQEMFTLALFASATAFAYYCSRRLMVRYNWDSLASSPVSEIARQVSSRRNHALQSASLCFFIFALVATANSEAWAAFWLALCICASLAVGLMKTRMKLVKRNRFETASPILARLMQEPNFATLAHDDLDTLSRIEQGAAALRAIEQSAGAPKRQPQVSTTTHYAPWVRPRVTPPSESPPRTPPTGSLGSFHQTMGDIIDATKVSKLRNRSPVAFESFANAIFQGRKIDLAPSPDLNREFQR